MKDTERHPGFVNRVGQRFGRLLVIREGQRQQYGPTWWVCKCDCGNEKSIRVSSLIGGDTQSCGCLCSERTRKANSKRPYEWIFTLIRHKSKQLPFPSTLTYESFLKFITITKCHYCSDTIVWSEHSRMTEFRRYNLDRKDNNVGYTEENCVVCCPTCNHVKGEKFTYEEMLRIGKLIENLRMEKSLTD